VCVNNVSFMVTDSIGLYPLCVSTFVPAIKQGNPKNGIIPTDHLVGQPRPEQRHEIIHSHEQVNILGGLVMRLIQTALEHRPGNVPGQNAAHAVIAKALAGLVANDVFDLGRPAIFRVWGTHAFILEKGFSRRF